MEYRRCAVVAKTKSRPQIWPRLLFAGLPESESICTARARHFFIYEREYGRCVCGLSVGIPQYVPARLSHSANGRLLLPMVGRDFRPRRLENDAEPDPEH